MSLHQQMMSTLSIFNNAFTYQLLMMSTLISIFMSTLMKMSIFQGAHTSGQAFIKECTEEHLHLKGYSIDFISYSLLMEMKVLKVLMYMRGGVR